MSEELRSYGANIVVMPRSERLEIDIGIIALGGGVIGYLLGYLLGSLVAQRVFAAAISLRPLVLLVTLATACLVTFLGSVLPLRRAVQIDPVVTLKGE